MALYGDFYVFEDDRVKIIQGESTPYGNNVLTKRLVDLIFFNIRATSRIVLPKSIIVQMRKKSYFVEICEDVWSIHIGAFRDCDYISKIRIANLKNNYETFTINEYAFAGSNLKTLEVDDISRKLYISKGAFACCKSLTKVELLSCKSISYAAFSRCESLETIKLPQNIGHVGDAVFDECKSLESIYIPKSYFDRWRIGRSVRGTNAQVIIYDEFNEYDEYGHVLNSISSIPEEQNIEVSERSSIIIPEIANKKTFKSFSGVIRPNLIANKKKNKL